MRAYCALLLSTPLPLSPSTAHEADTISTTNVGVDADVILPHAVDMEIKDSSDEKETSSEWNREKRNNNKKSVGNGNCLAVRSTCTSNTLTKHIIPKSRTNYLIIEKKIYEKKTERTEQSILVEMREYFLHEN